MPEPEASAPGQAMESVSRNAFFSLLTKLSSAAFTAGVTLFVTRYLGPAEYGLFALATSAGLLLVVLVDLGISASAARFIAERRDRLPAVVDVFSDALRVRLLTSAVLATALLLLAGPIASAYGEPKLTWPLRGVAIAAVGQSLMLLSAGTLAALGRLSAYFRVVLSESVVEATAIVTLVLVGGGAAGAAAGRAVGFAFGGVLALIALHRLLDRPGFVKRVTQGSSGYTRRLMGYGSALFLLDAAFTAFAQVDVLLIGAFLSANAVGLFEAPLRLTVFLYYFGLAAAEAIGPRVAGDTPDVATFERGLQVVWMVQLAVSTTVAVWAEPVVGLLLGPKYDGSVEVMRLLSVYAFLGGVGALLAHGANYLGLARLRVPIAVGAILINLVIDVILIPKIGIVAGAIGTGVAFAFFMPAHLWICHRVLDLNLRRLGLTAVRSLVAAAALAACLFAFGTDTLSPVEWVVGLVLGYGAYLTVLVATREVTLDELRWLAARGRSTLAG